MQASGKLGKLWYHSVERFCLKFHLVTHITKFNTKFKRNAEIEKIKKEKGIERYENWKLDKLKCTATQNPRFDRYFLAKGIFQILHSQCQIILS